MHTIKRVILTNPPVADDATKFVTAKSRDNIGIMREDADHDIREKSINTNFLIIHWKLNSR